MTVPAAKVRAICTTSEVELVRASRKPNLDELSATEVRRYAARARKLFDKWQGLSRGQARTHGRVVGTAEIDKNTLHKVTIFHDALSAFDARLKKLEATASKSAATAPPKTKKQRNAGHRATRAAVRKMTAEAEFTLNRKKSKRPAAK